MAAASSVGALPFSVERSKERKTTPLVPFSYRSGTTSSWSRGGGSGTITTGLRSHVLCGVSSRRALFLSRGVEIGGVRVPIRKKIAVKALTVDDDGTEDVGDDQLNAAIQKSKNALKVQKDLLQQIIEQRKHVSSVNTTGNREKDGSSNDVGSRQPPVSSVNDTNLNKEGDVSSTDDRFTKPLSDFNIAVKSVYLDQGHNSTSAEQENQGSKSVGESIKEGRDHLNESNVGKSVADALGLSQEIGPSTTLRKTDSTLGKSKVLPNLLGNYRSQVTISSGSSDEDVAKGSDANDAAFTEGSGNSTPLAGQNVMNIILAAAECAPWSKTGGLGDVAGALPKALAKRGHRVMVVVPRYGNYADQQEIGIRRRYKVAGQDMEISYFHAYIDGVDFVFIDSPIFSHRENNIYGGERQDILKRMVLFCKAAVEAPWHVPCGGVCYGDGNLVFIANDWHTALLPVYLKAYYRDNGLMKYTRSVLVIHNIAHQGRGPLNDFNLTDLPDHYSDLFKLCDPVGGQHFNIFAAGLKTADRIVTVSHGYTWELKTLEGGWGLHKIINENGWKLQGIVNGIDTKDWNPELDIYLKDDGYTNFSLETLKTGKAQCKAALQKELGLPVRDNVPLIGFIGRLDHQKGVDLIAEAIPWMASQDMQLVMLGTGRADLEDMLRRFEGQYNDKVRGWVGFSVKTAHRITAGADILLMPSRFEPCGLNQLYAMKYGTIPVVHAVGGLRDTVIQFDPFNNTGNGWTFDRAEANKLIEALGHCCNTFWNYKTSWEGLQTRGMMQDLSWDNASQHYEEVLVKAKYQW